MNSERSPRKDIIKNITIIFLAILLVLTFFSNTIMNYSLPQVSTVYAGQGTISEQIRGSGSISAAESYEVKLEQSREIKSVAVKTGQTVNAGDVLFELADKESTELTDAQNNLDTLEYEYKKAELALASKSGYESDYHAITRAEKELDRLKEKLADAESGKDDLSTASDSYKKAKEESDELTRQKDKLTAALASVDTDDMLDLNGKYYEQLRAAKDLVTENEKKVEKAKTAYEDLTKEYGDKTDYKDEITAKQNAIESAREELNALYVSLYSVDPDADTSSITASISAQNVKIRQLERELSDLMSKASSGSVAKTKLKTAEDSLKRAQDKLTSSKDALSNSIRNVKLSLKKELDAVNEKLIAATDKVNAAQDDKTAAESSGLLSAAQLKVKITEKEDEIQKLRDDLSIKQSTADAETQTSQLELEEKKRQIEKQKEKVEKLKSDTVDAVVKAKMGGVIESISVTAGSTVSAGTTAAVISVADLGYTLEFPVKTEQAKKVRVGDKAELTGWFNNGDITVTLDQIRPDTSNPQTQKILSFKVTGSDITTGQNLSISLGSKGQPYSTVVPNSAVREDSNGKFVLVMESKSSPLGNRYKAVRYDVSVTAKDDNNSAVSGLSGSEFVITTSTQPIKAGEQVRPAD